MLSYCLSFHIIYSFYVEIQLKFKSTYVRRLSLRGTRQVCPKRTYPRRGRRASNPRTINNAFLDWRIVLNAKVRAPKGIKLTQSCYEMNMSLYSRCV